MELNAAHIQKHERLFSLIFFLVVYVNFFCAFLYKFFFSILFSLLFSLVCAYICLNLSCPQVISNLNLFLPQGLIFKLDTFRSRSFIFLWKFSLKIDLIWFANILLRSMSKLTPPINAFRLLMSRWNLRRKKKNEILQNRNNSKFWIKLKCVSFVGRNRIGIVRTFGCGFWYKHSNYFNSTQANAYADYWKIVLVSTLLHFVW